MAKPKRDEPSLRGRAEERLQGGSSTHAAPTSEHDNIRMLHDLDVHQIELEMQNEELRSIRNELESQFQRYSELFDFAPIGYAMLAPEGVILAMNHAGAQLLGRERSRLLGTHFGIHVATSGLDAFASFLRSALGSETKQTCELDLARHDKTLRRVHFTAAPLIAEKPAVLLAFQDVSEQREREDRLIRTEGALRDMVRRKDDFLAILSHELRNPLAPIRSSLYVLERVDPAGEDARQARVTIDRQVSHLTRLVDDLLDVTRIARGKIQLHPERMELGDLVRSTMEDHRASFSTSGIQLEGRFDPGHFWINGDPARLVQTLSNLLGNAEKFTPRGGSVVVKLQRRGPRVALVVQDTGAGIDSRALGHLFEPFIQAPETMTRTRGGLGLGLTMVKGLAELHEGSVTIESEGPGHGTQVTVLLPLAPGVVVAPPVPPEGPVSHRRILVVDDNRDAADALRLALVLSGHEAQVAYDGESALELAQSAAFEIAICDIALPRMNGYMVAKAFREDPALRTCYLVALTGCAQPEDVQLAMEAGFDKHIAKPPNLNELNRLLADVPTTTA